MIDFTPRPTRRGEGEPPAMRFFGPLISVAPPGVPSPFRFADRVDLGNVVASLDLTAWDEGQFAQLWPIATGPDAAFTSVLNLQSGPGVRSQVISFDLEHRRHPDRRAGHSLTITCYPNPDQPETAAAVLSFFKLPPSAIPASSSPQATRDQSGSDRFDVANLPDDPEVGVRLAARFGEFMTLEQSKVESGWLMVGLAEPRYSQIRPALNQITPAWCQCITAFRNPDFDPYTPPASFGAESQFRIPVAQRGDPEPDPLSSLTVQVDAVHTPTGSYLEFVSTAGRKRLDQFAQLAGVELEHWVGPYFDRWGDRS